MRISTALLVALRTHAAASPDVEVCGLLFGAADEVTAAEPCRNVAGDPRRAFEIDPARLLAAHRAMRAGRARLIGWYHSHPVGDASPSRADAAAATPDDMLWLIVANATVKAWRAVARGAVHGRFDPVALVNPAGPER